MIYLKLFEGFEGIEDIDAICQKYAITNYTINSDGSIDVDGNVDLSSVVFYRRRVVGFERLPLKFNRVSGNFYCNDNKLVSLEGSPKEVGGNFSCHFNELNTLEGAPKWVGGNFYCNNNKLTCLEGAPKKVGGYFNCDKNPLPQLIIDNYEYIDEIIKWQDEYNIWRNGKLDKFRFEEMMIDIKNEMDQ